jgi:hypothetical protein
MPRERKETIPPGTGDSRSSAFTGSIPGIRRSMPAGKEGGCARPRNWKGLKKKNESVAACKRRRKRVTTVPPVENFLPDT